MILLLLLLLLLLATVQYTASFYSPTLPSHTSITLYDTNILISQLADASTIDYAAAISVPVQDIFQKAASKALSGGAAGASAGVLQVVSLMWLRTAMNYQYKAGGGTIEALRALYKEGGLGRLYQGLPFAIVQGPLSRFGDTAANALVYSLLDSVDPTNTVPAAVRTLAASISAGGFRILLMPIDTAKTCLQVNGASGLSALLDRVRESGPQVLFAGSLATCAATAVGHYPWFLTYNYLTAHLPTATQIQAIAQTATADPHSVGDSLLAGMGSVDVRLVDTARSALIGLAASCTSDVCSNSLRVLKTVRQSSGGKEGYLDSARSIVEEQGIKGLLGRGLQGMLFSVLFKYFQAKYT